MALHKPPSKPQNVGDSGTNASFQRVALNPQVWPGLPPKRPSLAQPDLSCITGEQVGANWSCCAEVGPKEIQMDPKLKPCDAHVGPSQVQHGTALSCFAVALHQVGPNGDTTCGTWGTWLPTKRHR